MAIAPGKLSDPVVGALVSAVNAHDKAAFLALLTADATMSDDGTERDLNEWIDREIFDSGGHMDVESESDGGRTLTVGYRNDTWGEMRTSWRFVIAPGGGRISRFETGQA
ncbi:nuclear transport factor 2 family protein [Streptomyces sp. NBC_01264]|uniref:nuclear transport factor 2 family protein n=1 Tax=Streptomyces sp. NBC_01264 TaxID=2903804 RepID=UPI002255D7F0|nr:nuclear transport factor 2 family protein [Streptomyces sp. NBC_01264]MCX4780735.1 nuclear transport factor 2 family protein [Streptomyces sp. NBC_01264]